MCLSVRFHTWTCICFGKHGDWLICQVSLAHITEGGWFSRKKSQMWVSETSSNSGPDFFKMTSTKHLKFILRAQSPQSSAAGTLRTSAAGSWNTQKFPSQGKFPLFFFMQRWQAVSFKATYLKPNIFIVYTLTLKLRSCWQKLLNLFHRKRNQIPTWIKAKDKAINPPRLLACATHCGLKCWVTSSALRSVCSSD